LDLDTGTLSSSILRWSGDFVLTCLFFYLLSWFLFIIVTPGHVIHTRSEVATSGAGITVSDMAEIDR